MYADWGPLHLSLVCYIFHLLIPLLCKTWFSKDCKHKLQKPCSRCNKNTWHVESSCILQPPKYLLLFVNRFRYINNNVTKDRCSIPMETTVRLGPLKFSLRATIDHGPSIYSGHYTASIMALAHPLHAIDNRSRNRRRNPWVGWCVSSWWPLSPSRSSVLINIYMLF